MTITRRHFLTGATGIIGASTLVTAGYAGAIEPALRLVVTEYNLTPPGWPRDFPLKIAVIADPHAAEPYMGAGRIEEIVATTNALAPDLVVLLGDFEANYRFKTRAVPREIWARLWAECRAPLGVRTILGNHDWWFNHLKIRAALDAAGLPVMENDAVRLVHRGRPFWLLGLGDQIAHIRGPHHYEGVDDLSGTLAKVTDDSPAILLAHEPDIFVEVPERVSLTLAGHTHGGQIRMFGYSPIVPSSYGNRFAYGHIIENGRHMIVSGGLGCSFAPVRLGVPPEIVLVRLGNFTQA
ncbi:MAG TPA: metallophosphoesterase [Xanthobacteraceae bacterium]|nr:metallophosphoesterase [Xanthobacteraceae bacterium]